MRFLRVASALVPVVFLAGCDIDDFVGSEKFRSDFHYTLKPTQRLSIESFNGEVEIAGWDEPSIEVTGVKYASTEASLDAIKIDVRESPAVTEIRTTRPNMMHGNQGARFLIRAPRATLIDQAVSSNGAIRIHDMTASARIHTSNGAVRVENVQGGVEAETSNGGIQIDSVTGKLRLHTSNGQIRASEITGACDAETSNGQVVLRYSEAPNGPSHVHTSNGSVDVSMRRPPKDGLRAETSNGSITVELPANVAAHLNAGTSGGGINSEFDVTGHFESGEKHHVEGDIGGGGPVLELHTNNGGIHVRKGSAGTN